MHLKRVYTLVLMLGLPAYSFCMEEIETVKLLSSDGKEFTFTKKEAQESGTLKELLSENLTPGEAIPVPGVSAVGLAALAEYLPLSAQRTKYHEQGDTAAEEAVNSKIHNTWLRDFENEQTSKVLEVLKAAHYLGIEFVIDRLAHTIARRASFIATSEDQYRRAQNLRKAAIFFLDPATAKEHGFGEPSAEVTQELGEIWLEPTRVKFLPRDLRKIIAEWVLTEYQLAEGEHAAGYSEGYSSTEFFEEEGY